MAKRNKKPASVSNDYDIRGMTQASVRSLNESNYNNKRTKMYNLNQDRKNKRVKRATTSLFYYAGGEARKVTNANTGKEIGAKRVEQMIKNAGKTVY